jgi:hypothetical protein
MVARLADKVKVIQSCLCLPPSTVTSIDNEEAPVTDYHNNCNLLL